jgi:hypothetical protein
MQASQDGDSDANSKCSVHVTLSTTFTVVTMTFHVVPTVTVFDGLAHLLILACMGFIAAANSAKEQQSLAAYTWAGDG